MKFLASLEKSKLFWSVLGLGFLFFLLRLPTVIEPYWYGDEGIYEVIGSALNHGRILYTGIWDNKPPLLYLVYAAANGDQLIVRLLSLFVGVGTAVVFFFLSKKLFNSLRTSVITTLLFTLLFATPLIEGTIANAENFMLLPIIAAGLLLFTQSKKNYSLFTAGLLLGIAFLFKIVAVFDFAAFTLFLSFLNIEKVTRKQITSAFTQLFPLIFGFFLPLFVTILYFAYLGSLGDFIHAAFFGNVDYVGFENNYFNIPHGLLILKIILLFIWLTLVFLKRKSFSRPVLFITLWGILTLFSTFFSGRPYTHYLLVFVPSYCLIVGIFIGKSKTFQLPFKAVLLIVSIFFYGYFSLNAVYSLANYQNAFLYITGQRNLTNYQSFYDYRVPRDYDVASFIKGTTTGKDDVFIWGDDASIYVLSGKLPPGKYTTAYHIIPDESARVETQNAIERVQPKYIITLSETQPLPFPLPLYIMRFSMDGATIYERSF